MHTITLNLRQLLAELETRNNKRYGYVDFETATKGRISRQTARYILNTTVARVDLETLGGLLDFFHAEGLPVDVGDLFVVTRAEGGDE